MTYCSHVPRDLLRGITLINVNDVKVEPIKFKVSVDRDDVIKVTKVNIVGLS